jgi:P27 family predicted phage terminase small subunit
MGITSPDLKVANRAARRGTKTGRSSPPKAPEHLSSQAKVWWAELVKVYDLDTAAQRLLLQTAMEAFGLMRHHQAIADEEGHAYKMDSGLVKTHPSLIIVKDSRTGMLTALRDLKIDTSTQAEKAPEADKWAKHKK